MLEAPNGFWRHALTRAFLATAIFVVFDLADIFRIGDAPKSKTEEILNNILAPFHESKADDKIAIILVNESIMCNIVKITKGNNREKNCTHSNAWPPAYHSYEYIISALADLEPKAVFIDLLFDAQRDTDETWPILLRSLSYTIDPSTEKPASPFIFAATAQTKDKLPLEVNGEGYWPNAPVNWHLSLGPRYPLAVTMEYDHRQHFTPAAMLYCLDGMNRPEVCKDWERAIDDSRPLAPISLRWDDQPSPSQEAWLAYRFGGNTGRPPEPCRAGPEKMGFRESLLQSLEFAKVFLLNQVEERPSEYGPRLYNRCSPYLTLHADQLVWAYQGHKLTKTGQNFGQMRDLLRGRYIFIGLDSASYPDLTFSPIHQTVPGVFQHATALDNLITFGSNYPGHAGTFGPFAADRFFTAALWLVGVLMSAALYRAMLGLGAESGAPHNINSMRYYIISIFILIIAYSMNNLIFRAVLILMILPFFILVIPSNMGNYMNLIKSFALAFLKTLIILIICVLLILFSLVVQIELLNTINVDLFSLLSGFAVLFGLMISPASVNASPAPKVNSRPEGEVHAQ